MLQKFFQTDAIRAVPRALMLEVCPRDDLSRLTSTSGVILRLMSPRRSNAAELLPTEDAEIDPVWAAFERAPVAKEAESEEQRQLADAAKRGPFRPSHVVSAELADRCDRGN